MTAGTLNLDHSYSYNTSFMNVAGAETFRLGSRAFMKQGTSFKGWGGNVQNISKKLRRNYEAKKGYNLHQFDQAGAEALIVAMLCEKGRFRDLFIHGIKPHVFVALHYFLDVWKAKFQELDLDSFIQTPISKLKDVKGWKEVNALIKKSDDWAAHERYYFIAKMVCHSSNYDIMAEELRINILEKSEGTVVLTKEQAITFLENYHALFPEIRRWHREIERIVRETGMLFNLQGDPRIITTDITARILKELYAFIPQSTVGCITHDATVDLTNYIIHNDLDWYILTNTHDSYLVMAPEADREHCREKGLEFLQRELTSPRGEKFRMKAEAQWGYNWGPQKEDNPEGMREYENN